MFDFGISEILVTSAIALVVVGPQRLPGVIKRAAGFVAKARVVARRFNDQLNLAVVDLDSTTPRVARMEQKPVRRPANSANSADSEVR